ncbi:MAG: COX15/CtaA family protein [Burkholderiales bacterium]|nr:COX15/CtaA family protein [Burkholderiales bacterium]
MHAARLAAVIADPSHVRARRLIRRLAAAGVLVVIVVLAMSALLRLRAAGLGCADWPACYGQTPAAAAAAPALPRLLHRVSAMAATFAVIGIAVFATVRVRLFRGELVLSGVMFALLAGLATLGRGSAGATQVVVPLGNVLGGMVLVALFSWIAAAGMRRQASAPRWLPPLAWAALLALLVQVGLGVMTSATHSGLACPGLSACTSAQWQELPGALDPFRPPAASAALHALHRVAGVAVLGLVLAVAWASRRVSPELALLLGAFAVLQAALGAVLVAASLPLAVAVVHNVGATVLVCALVAAARAGVPSRPTFG